MKYNNIRTIDVSDWDQLVFDTYGKPYTFQQQDGCQPRGKFEITIPCDAKYEEEEMHDNIPFKINGYNGS